MHPCSKLLLTSTEAPLPNGAHWHQWLSVCNTQSGSNHHIHKQVQQRRDGGAEPMPRGKRVAQHSGAQQQQLQLSPPSIPQLMQRTLSQSYAYTPSSCVRLSRHVAATTAAGIPRGETPLRKAARGWGGERRMGHWQHRPNHKG